MSEVLKVLRAEYVQLADSFEQAEANGQPAIELSRRVIMARKELQATAKLIAVGRSHNGCPFVVETDPTF